MAEREIRIGGGESFRYVGVNPSITEDDLGIVMNTISLPEWMISGYDDSYIQRPIGATAVSLYTEFRYDIEAAEEEFGKSHVDNVALILACQIAEILKRRGDSVKLDPDITPTDSQTPMFGETADLIRCIRRIVAERRN
jgi:hypothetical protein